MEIEKGIEIKDLCLYLRKEKILIISDVHIGYEEMLNKQGIMVPRLQQKETIEKLKKILENLELNEIIINGDLKHEFGTISETEWRNTLELIDLLKKYCDKLTLIKGNHDTILEPITSKRELKIENFRKINNILICHGDKILEESKIIIIGHEHPAISLKKDGRIEVYKCFLKGKYKRSLLIVMPSFITVTEGTDVLKEERLSPYLPENLENFEVYIVEDNVYYFGKIKDI